MILFPTAIAAKHPNEVESFIDKIKAEIHSTIKSPAPLLQKYQMHIKKFISKNPFESNEHRSQIKVESTPLETTVLPIHYANAEFIASLLTNKSLALLSKQGSIIAAKPDNLLIVHDDRMHILKIKQLLTRFDIPQAQILIKARVINIDNNYSRSLGILFNTTKNTDKSEDGFNLDLPISGLSFGAIQFPILKLKENLLLNLQLTALEQAGHAQLLSSPELITINRKPAIIESGEEVPYQESTASGATSVVFKKAVLRLKVVPEILPKQHVLLHLSVNQDKVSTLTVNGTPAILTRQLQTQVIVGNKQTFVLGGIYEKARSQQHEGVPMLNRIPVLGALFRQHTQKNNYNELLIFITPEILSS